MALTVRLSDEVQARLERLSELTGRSKAYYIKHLLEEHLDDLEDYYIGMQALERLRAGKSATLSGDEMRRRLALDD